MTTKTEAQRFAEEQAAFYAQHPEITFLDPSVPQAEQPKIGEMHITPSDDWKKRGDEPDTKLYSLEADPALEMIQNEEGKFETFATHGYSGEMNLPEYERITGTYEEVSAEAWKMNNKQRLSGFLAFIFSPAPIEPMGIA